MKKTVISFSITLIILLLFVICFVSCYPNSNVYYAKQLVAAIKEENIEEVTRILDKKPDCVNALPSLLPLWMHGILDYRVMYPLTEACYTGNVELVKLLLDRGADINCNDGLTPLYATYVSKNENWYEISLLLLDNGADINYKTEYSGKNTAILLDIMVKQPLEKDSYVAEREGEVMAAFLYAMERCDHSQVDWNQVLQKGVFYNRVEITKYLLENGYCNANDHKGNMTPLMFAARNCSAEMVELLLSYGADKAVTDKGGKTAYDYAIENGYTDIAELIKP